MMWPRFGAEQDFVQDPKFEKALADARFWGAGTFP